MKKYLLFSLFLLVFFNLASFLKAQETNEHDQLSPQRTEEMRTEAGNRQQSLDWPPTQNEDEESANRSEHETDNFQAKFLNMLLLLGLIVVFMLIASWSLKRLMKNRVTQLNTQSSIKVLETRALSPRSTLYLVEVQGQQLLIAETATTVSHLTSVEDSTLPERPLSPSSRSPEMT